MVKSTKCPYAIFSHIAGNSCVHVDHPRRKGDRAHIYPKYARTYCQNFGDGCDLIEKRFKVISNTICVNCGAYVPTTRDCPACGRPLKN